MTTTTPSTAPLAVGDIVRTKPMQIIDIWPGYLTGILRARVEDDIGSYEVRLDCLEPTQSAPDVAKAVAFYEAGKKALETVDRMFSEPGKLNERTVAKMVRDTLAITKDNPNVL